MLQLPLSRARPCSHAAGSRRQSAAVQSTDYSFGAQNRTEEQCASHPCVMHRSCGRLTLQRCSGATVHAMHACCRPTVGLVGCLPIERALLAPVRVSLQAATGPERCACDAQLQLSVNARLAAPPRMRR